MNNFLTLYRTELRKIADKKAVWLAMAAGLALILLVSLTNLSADGRMVYVKEQSEVLSALSGTPMDEAFFEDFKAEVSEHIEKYSETFDAIRAYDPAAVFENAASGIGKKALYDLVYNTVRSREDAANVTAESFYAKMRDDILRDGREIGATGAEEDEWLRIFDGIEKPITYSYALAYLNILDVLFLIGWVLILNITIALSGSFADEKSCRTDAIILSCRKGRLPVCGAKLLAGVTAAAAECFVLIGTTMAVMLSIYGRTGWNARIQNVIPSSPWDITIGKMMLIYFALALLVSIFFAVTNMAASYLTKSAASATAIHAAMLFAGLFNIPGKMRVISKLWQLRPTMALYYGTFCNTFRYGRLNNVQISFLIYGILSAALAAFIALSYKKSQVESR